MIVSILLWGLCFTLIPLSIYFFSYRMNALAPKDEVYSDEAAAALLDEKFPRIYGFYASLVLFLFLGIALVPVMYFYLAVVPAIQEWMLAGTGYIAWSPANHFVIPMLLTFIQGLCFSQIVLFPLGNYFRKLGRYMEQGQLKKWDIRMKGDSKYYLRLCVKLFVILTVVNTPLLFLAINTYHYVDANALHYNSFWDFEEKSINLNELAYVEAGIGTDRDKETWYSYTLVFKDKSEFWFQDGSSITPLKELDSLLLSRGVPIQFRHFDPAGIEYARIHLSQEKNEFITQVFVNERPRFE